MEVNKTMNLFEDSPNDSSKHDKENQAGHFDIVVSPVKKATIQLINADCLPFMKQCSDKQFDLAIVDPPYGIGMSMGHKGSEKRGDKNKYKNFAGNDSEIPSSQYFKELFRISKNQIIWGGNYFTEHLSATGAFVIWDKVQPENFSMAMCEFAWTSFEKPAKLIKIRVVGADEVRIHGTQKPVDLYKWLLHNYAKAGDKIIDTHLGSGSIALACEEYGYDLVGIEIDQEYFAAASKRLSEYRVQKRLF